MTPKEYLTTALEKIDLGKHDEALNLLTKAEQSSIDEKFPDASFNKGLLYDTHFQDYKKAMDAYTKAEQDSPSAKYPKASNRKGLLLHNRFRDYHKALKSYNKAEIDSPNGKYPSASNNKGVLLGHCLHKFPEALDAYLKAEKDSPNGKMPAASLNRGVLLENHFRDYNKALQAYTKAEQDSPFGKYPKASYVKGFLYEHCFHNYDKALASYTKSENDSPNGKHPSSTKQKGDLYAIRFQQFQRAIQAYKKAERDSPEGKYPAASNNLGVLYATQLQEFQKAIDSLSKAEKDSPHEKYPEASKLKGQIYAVCFEDFENALMAFSKAEKDSPNGKHPAASFNKSIIFFNQRLINLALKSCQKAIDDSKPQVFAEAYSILAHAHLLLGERKKAYNYTFISLHHGNRLNAPITLLVKHLGMSAAVPIYKSRLAYLTLFIHGQSDQMLNFGNKTDNHIYLIDKIRKPEDYFFLLCLETKLEIPDLVAPEGLERLQLAYLVAYYRKDYAYVFHIIDELIDGTYPLTEMDIYFYLVSAFLIGEPVNELQNLAKEEANNQSSAFYKSYLQLGAMIDDAVLEKRFIDPYLLDIPILIPFSFEEVENEVQHPWLASCLKSILNSETYQVPVPESELNGLIARLILEQIEIELDDQTKEMSCWQNFVGNIELKRFGQVQFDNIIDCINKKVAYELLLYELFRAYDQASHERDKHNIAVLQALVMLYSKGNFAVSKGISTDSGKTVLSTLSDLGAKEIFGALLAMGFAVDLGISLASSILVGKAADIIKDRLSLNKKIEELKRELL